VQESANVNQPSAFVSYRKSFGRDRAQLLWSGIRAIAFARARVRAAEVQWSAPVLPDLRHARWKALSDEVTTLSPTPFSKAEQLGFDTHPASWYYLGTVQELSKKPLRLNLPGDHAYVGFRTKSGKLAVLNARCAHMGADLGSGCVIGERLACPLHGWEYNREGNCEHLPASTEIPAFARQVSFPVEERGGHVFFFNRPQARFPLSFFDGVHAEALLAAPRFEFVVEAPWYLVSANGFDLQHFRCAHDRTLVDEPVLSSPHPFAWRLDARFLVTGHSWMDRVTRWFSGSSVEMTVTNWCGNLVLVAARFRRTTTYGLVSFIPLEGNRTWVRDIIWVPRRRWPLRAILDPIDARIRRLFIREFVKSDVERSAGIRYNPRRMIEADKLLVEYLAWLRRVQH
jgi:phenylpropionate dioxygenase-like ring-hydroxylating dioxygenase large terminal subunit